ncbi:hypothetical protein EUTSA_v10012599mg [Eutrema salsugineum]|uniref:Uncharacterized protein n=1 Tax=Eutrema salsugineum TaxID=72664 RepID=V4LCY1_EUTSA|nr:uncharacterized protein LOC18018160 [Eutrema salsugineum]ESQ41529.1 hypothetical protein EUTSA_v10012599mg [Eutrema salsugineum]
MQQSGYDEMQLLQQQVMLKQLHALQMQQQNFLNPYSSTVQKQANNSGLQFPPLLDEMPLNDSSQGYLNWAQGNAFPGQQGTLDKTMFSVGLGSQQPDLSLYGTPVANTRGNIGQKPPIQVMYQDPGSLAARLPSGQSQKSLMQSSDFSYPFFKSQYDLSPPQASLHNGAFMSNLGVRGMSEAGSFQGLSNGIHSGNLLSQQFDTSSKNSSRRQEEQASWSSFQQKGTKQSQGLVPLDPLEEKILFNMEDSSISEIASGVFGDKFDSVNISSPFPSMQSGSWSALMQTAVAEASSSDTGLQEEFSGLTYQNMELPADINDISNFLDSDKQQAGGVNNNTLHGSASLNSSFPGFQVPSDQLGSGVFQDDSTLDSTQRSSNVTGHWMDFNPQPKISFENVSTGNMYLQSSGMLDQLQSQTGNHRSITADSSASQLAGMSSTDQGGKWLNVPRQLGKPGIFPQHIQQNDLATVSVSQMQMINPFVASQPDNATFPGVNLDAGLGGHTFSQTRSPQQGTNQQFNVWMDLPTRQHPLDQESLKVPLSSTSPVEISGSDVTTSQKAQRMSPTAYNMPQKFGLPQEQGAAAKNISDFTASNKDSNKLQGENNMDYGTCLKSMSQLESCASDDPKMEQNVCSSGKQPTLASGMVRCQLNLPASAPVWFKQMGAYRNDQMQPVHDSQETRDQLLQQFEPLNTMNKHVEIIATKKRKLMRTKQLSWHEEVSNASQRDHSISGAEQEWARVTNLLVEKAEYGTQTFEFAPPLHRSKRRLVLTSQLMQQLFDPPPSFIFSAASSRSYDFLFFFIARATLGDACSLTHKGETVLPSSSSEVENIPEKTENCERKDVQHSEVAKKLIDKAEKLKESFERLEKTPSVADIKFDIADSERFSVINRFARFHSKGSVSGNPSQSTLLKPIPQRYVAMGPLPRYLPEGVQCLSL